MALPRSYKHDESRKVGYFGLEVSWGTRWIDLNDKVNYRVASEGTREGTTKAWRKVTAESPILGGNYLIHAVPDMVNEQVGLWVYGVDQTELSENLRLAEEAFTQYDFRLRWTMDEFREIWRCQLAEVSSSRGHVMTHNYMAQVTFSVPRYPNVTTETVI